MLRASSNISMNISSGISINVHAISNKHVIWHHVTSHLLAMPCDISMNMYSNISLNMVCNISLDIFHLHLTNVTVNSELGQYRTIYAIQHVNIFRKDTKQKFNMCSNSDSESGLRVMIVRRLNCSSMSPRALPALVKGVSYMKRRILLFLSNIVDLFCSSLSSKYGLTCVTWM